MFKKEPLINHVLLIGDRMPYVTALITVTGDPATAQAVVASTVKNVNRQLPSFEQIRKFKILDRDFSIEHGELTPTMKLRRSRALENHRALVSELYAGRDPERTTLIGRASRGGFRLGENGRSRQWRAGHRGRSPGSGTCWHLRTHTAWFVTVRCGFSQIGGSTRSKLTSVQNRLASYSHAVWYWRRRRLYRECAVSLISSFAGPRKGRTTGLTLS
jgi:hypothetical protein